jgi:hypothetical protein
VLELDPCSRESTRRHIDPKWPFIFLETKRPVKGEELFKMDPKK